MSHSLGMEDDQGREWVAIHNGDWSGDVTLRRLSEDENKEEYTIPGEIVRQMSRAYCSSEVIALIERWADGEKP